jgi:hypothetical protein
MPLELWLDIAEYKIDVDAIAEYLSRLQNIKDGEYENTRKVIDHK